VVATLFGLGSALSLGIGAAAAAPLPPPQVAKGVSGAAFTPITIQAVDVPALLRGSDGSGHAAFELLLTNISARQASVTGVTVRSGSATGTVLEQLDPSGVSANMTAVGDLSLTKTSTLPSHATNQLVLDAVVPPSAPRPARLSVTLSATFQAPQPGQPSFVSIFPDAVTEQLPALPVSNAVPTVLSPPLTGGDWVSVNACCDMSPHRAAILGGDGVPAAPERYGIDFVRIGGNGGLYAPGSPPSMATNYSYGAKLLAVAASSVVAIQDGLPDQPPEVNPSGYTLDQLGGNYIVLRLRAHVYALYAHIAPGTIQVKVGQHVRSGQTLALLGNSGNSTAPHLHFQLMNGPGLLTSQGLPYAFPTFKVLAVPGPDGMFNAQNPAQAVSGAYPLTSSVIAFPGGTSAPVSPSPEPTAGSAPET
jgi:hypothetical protein